MGDAAQLLIRGAIVISGVPGEAPLRDAAVLVEAERIAAVGPWTTMRSAAPAARVLGGEGHWVLPAFVNAHYHNWRTFSMGATPDLPLEPFMLRASGFEVPPDLEAEFSRLNTLVSAIQLVRSGVALTIDMPLSSNHRPVLDAYRMLGLDVVYAPTLRTQNGFVYDDDARFLASLPMELRARIEG